MKSETIVDIPAPLNRWIADWISKKTGSTQFVVEPLAGDGSTRLFVRVRYNKTQCVTMYDSGWRFSKDYPLHQSFLKNAGIPVPEFLEIDPAAGILVMEDLGDELLQNRIVNVASDRKMEWATKAVVFLAHLHGRTYPVPPNLPAATREFDAKKYTEELEFTVEHLHRGWLNLPPSPLFLGAIKKYCEEIQGVRPWGFSHRDYHSRNLLVRDGGLFLIDFQDARLGPPHYDLASFIFDAYFPLNETERTALITSYQSALQPYPIAKLVDWKNFVSDTERIAIQRLLKAAGSFASFFTRYGKSTHLSYLKPALTTARHLLQKQPDSNLLNTLPIDTWLAKTEERLCETKG